MSGPSGAAAGRRQPRPGPGGTPAGTTPARRCAPARRPPPRGFGGGGPFGGPGLPPEKPKDFRGTFGRLVGTLRPGAPRILIVIAFAIVSVTCAVVGPKILGNATDILFDGVVSQQIPAGPDPAAGGRRAARRRPDAAGEPCSRA